MRERRTIECIWLSLISAFTWIQLKAAAAVTLDPSDYEYCKLKLMQACTHCDLVLFLYILNWNFTPKWLSVSEAMSGCTFQWALVPTKWRNAIYVSASIDMGWLRQQNGNSSGSDHPTDRGYSPSAAIHRRAIHRTTWKSTSLVVCTCEGVPSSFKVGAA